MNTGARAQEQVSSSVLDAIGVGLVVVEISGEIVLQNSIADRLALLRVEARTLLEVVVEMAIGGDTPAQAAAEDVGKLEAVAPGSKPTVIEYRIVRSSRLGTVITLRDISDQERVRIEQRHLERLSQVGKACAMVAHEIGNPLAAIKATIQSIEPEAAAAGLQDPIAVLHCEIDRLDKVLGQLLGYVRHRPPRRARIDAASLIGRARGAVNGRLRGITLSTTCSGTSPVWADPDQLEQVLINLLLNAADAQPGGGRVDVNVRADGSGTEIRVVDAGPGIAPELRHQVFDSFYTTKPAGTGLGLAICYRIVTEHGGSIAVTGAQPHGACVSVTLPPGPEA